MSAQQKRFRHLWAKTLNGASFAWHPLILHLIDVAVVAEAILEREPEQSRVLLADVLGMEWGNAEPWLLLLAAAHDLGKAFPGFQGCCSAMIPGLTSDGLDIRKSVNIVRHGLVSHVEIASLLTKNEFGGWNKCLANQVAEAAGCHHGVRFSSSELDNAQTPLITGNDIWKKARHEVFCCLYHLFGLSGTVAPIKKSISGPEFMRLAGWISFADWIASDESRFPYGSVDDLDNLEAWLDCRRKTASRALGELGWHTRIAPASVGMTFEELFPGRASPRPLQRIVAEQAGVLAEPSVLLVEAPMGEGKTEAAWHAHLLLRERFGHRGLYLALPTRATGNAMFARVLEFLKTPALRDGIKREVDLQLLHGSASLNPNYEELRLRGIYETNADAQGDVTAGEWFTHKKRALLSEYGVGTVDQALLAVLPVRHNFIRMWGLANRAVILDEVHAYDTYTTKLILTLVEWLVELGSSVILLSATVPPSFRRTLAQSLGTALDETAAYPRLTVFSKNGARQFPFPASPEGRRTVRVEWLAADVEALAARLGNFTEGTALVLVNTVDRAQNLYRLFPGGEYICENGAIVGKRLADDSEIYLFHSRFPAGERQCREERILREFGKDSAPEGRKILIATQVAEQSLDLDFDFMISDLAPTDLLLQRTGRLWRHQRNDRRVGEPAFAIAGLAGDAPPDFGQPLWWGAVYREDILILSWIQWRGLGVVELPGDIDRLVTNVYEKNIEVPSELNERYQKAEDGAEGKIFAHGNLAAMMGIGHPDEFFDITGSGLAYDDDDIPFGPSKKNAPTRLGDASATVIVIPDGEELTPSASVGPEAARKLFLRALPITRKNVIFKLCKNDIPTGWKLSSLLRNTRPFCLDAHGRWMEDPSVFLDPELGLCYGSVQSGEAADAEKPRA